MHFWSATIARYLAAQPPKKVITVRMISEETYILPEDIVVTLKQMQLLEQCKQAGASSVINRAGVNAWMAEHRVSITAPVDVGAFVEKEKPTDEAEASAPRQQAC